MLKKQKLKQKVLISGFCLYLVLSIQLLAANAASETDEKLKGAVEQSQSSPQAKDVLKGSVEQQDVDMGKENPAEANADPDATDKELMIEWDRWRNRFFQAVLSGTTDILNSDQAQHFQFNPQTNTIESKYPFGTVAWFSCKITKDGQVSEVLIERPSGYPAYDEAVREAAKALARSAILKFPSRSKRVSVLQAGGVQRTAQASKQYFHFGDIEHYRVPAN